MYYLVLIIVIKGVFNGSIHSKFVEFTTKDNCKAVANQFIYKNGKNGEVNDNTYAECFKK